MISIPMVCKRLALSRSTVLRLMCSDSTFPRKRIVSPGRVGILASELDQWIQSRPTATEVSHGGQ